MNTLNTTEIQQLLSRTEEFFSNPFEPLDTSRTDVCQLFRRTKELANELIREVECVNAQNVLLERQKLEMEQRFNSSYIKKENEQLRTAMQQLHVRNAEMDRRIDEFRRRYEDIDHYNTALSSVYIASNQLHSTLDFSEVVKTAEEILWNLVAAPAFAIFLRPEKGEDLKLVGGIGIEGRFPHGALRDPAGMINDALSKGVSLFIDAQTSGDPLACIPLQLQGRGTVGLIVIYEIEQHKGGLSNLDKELFDLLASQTATAMTSSRVYGETMKKLKSMESFISLVSGSDNN